jgi:tripartite-type tricarboxylate transporter receptor subunit TctC
MIADIPRRAFMRVAAAGAALSAFPHAARALDYPTRPVHCIIGFPPGGGADIVARILGAWLAERLGQQVIIENRPGENGRDVLEKIKRRRHQYRDRVRGALGPRWIHAAVGWREQSDQREHLLRPVV